MRKRNHEVVSTTIYLHIFMHLSCQRAEKFGIDPVRIQLFKAWVFGLKRPKTGFAKNIIKNAYCLLVHKVLLKAQKH